MKGSPAAALLGASLWACGGDPQKSDTGGDGDALPQPISDAPLCDGAPVITWDSWGQGFMVESCQACHASTSGDRRGAPEGVHFDSREATLEIADRVLARATGGAPSMPPMGGVLDEDRERLLIWLTCWE